MMYFRQDGKDRINLTVGTIDPLYLFGEGADGVQVPTGGYGRALASGMGGHEFSANEIPGVTDDMPLMLRGKRIEGKSDS